MLVLPRVGVTDRARRTRRVVKRGSADAIERVVTTRQAFTLIISTLSALNLRSHAFVIQLAVFFFIHTRAL